MAPLRLLLAAVAVSSARGSSNTVAITHTSTLASQAHAYAQQGLSVTIVKEKPLRDEEEYVTDFYSRVRDRRKAMFGRQLREQDVIERREQEDHSLDHYFDHRLTSYDSHHHPTKSEGKPAVEHEEEVTAKGSSSCAARSVRGGGLTRPLRRQHDHDLPYVTASGHHQGDHGHHDEEYCDTASARLDDASSAGHRRHGRRGGHPRRQPEGHHHHPSSRHSRSHHIREQARSHGLLDDDLDDGYDGYDALVDYDVPREEYGLEEEGHGGDDYPEHHLGLLRVPCSIAINAGEGGFGHHHQPASSHHHHHHQGGSQAKTEVAAYVDTGAQVTVISAAAAKRAGIYHLMDRRYAGRATGVGHCRVLGRIPARHVYFMLGEGCDDEEEGYDDDECRDGRDVSRGGGSEHRPRGEGTTARMDGPALTVLEGTVTKGVDILLGLDVLRDWEAEIRMGARQSLTVRKRRNRHGGGGSVVIPFASPAGRQAEARGTASRPSRRVGRRDPHGHRPHPRASTTTTTPAHRRHKPASHDILREEEEEDDDYSPTASDIESDLDLLDQSGHEFPEESYVDSKSIREMEDELLGIDSDDMDEGERDDDEDDDDLDLEEEDEEGDFDMAGL